MLSFIVYIIIRFWCKKKYAAFHANYDPKDFKYYFVWGMVSVLIGICGSILVFYGEI